MSYLNYLIIIMCHIIFQHFTLTNIFTYVYVISNERVQNKRTFSLGILQNDLIRASLHSTRGGQEMKHWVP